MKKAMKAVETTGVVDSEGRLILGDLMEELGPGPVRVILLLPDDNAGTAITHDGRMTSVRQVCDFFVKKAKHLEVVQEIALVGEHDVLPQICAVTSAARMDFEALYPIYDIQSDISRATDRAIVEIRVLNRQDFPPHRQANILPASAKSLWKREYAPAI